MLQATLGEVSRLKYALPGEKSRGPSINVENVETGFLHPIHCGLFREVMACLGK